jgi:hypothetical protein
MPKAALEIPPVVGRAFVDAMRAFYDEPSEAKRGEMAVQTMHTLRDHWRGNLKLHQVVDMFHEMRQHIDGLSSPPTKAARRSR